MESKADTLMQTCSPFLDITKPPTPNPKVSAIIADAIINNGEPSTSNVEPSPPSPKKMKMTKAPAKTLPFCLRNMTTPAPKKMKMVPPAPLKEVALPKITALSLSALDDDDEPDTIRYDPTTLPIIDDGQDDEYTIDDLPSPEEIAAKRRFDTLFPLFWEEKQIQHRGELMYLLNLMYRMGMIDEDYRKDVSHILSEGNGIEQQQQQEEDEVEDEAGEEEEEEKSLEDKITDTLDYLIRHDRDEIEKLLKVFEKDQNVKEDVAMLRNLAELYIDNVRLGKEPTQDDIERLLDKLKKVSSIRRSELFRFGMILREIERNRYRVSDILRRMDLVFEDPDDVSRALKGLFREELINDEQFQQLSDKNDTLDMDDLISVIKSTKVGRGVKFLPRQVDGLKVKLRECCGKYDEDPTDPRRLKKKIMAILDELKYRKVIMKKEHKDYLEHLEEQ